MFGSFLRRLAAGRGRSVMVAVASSAVVASPAPVPLLSAPSASREAPPETSFFDKEARADAYKKHFADSYDAVARAVEQREQADAAGENCAETRTRARLRVAVAKVLMERLGYSKEDLDVIGDDADRMQGTGNPFPLADLKPGEIVLDLGSGFGVDAILAGSKVGAGGRVVGVDLSIKEVSDANRRVLDRGISNVRFYRMDIERLAAIPDGSIDCVISNGGFCLVPNKRRAFREIYRVLRPGSGRFAISCTTLRRGYGHINKFMTDEAAAAVFPSCMEVFMPLDAAVPMLESLGFESVHVDESNAKMSVWDDVEREMQSEVDAALAREAGLLPEDPDAARQQEVADASWIDSAVAEVRRKREGADDATGGARGEAERVGLVLTGASSTSPPAAPVGSTGMEAETAREASVGNVTTDSGNVVALEDAGASKVKGSLERERRQAGSGVHSGGAEYEQLSALSMDDICARVVLYGVRPVDEHV